jgi:rhamnogalacturonan acetylesterase
VIICSPTPDNPWETGTFEYAPNRFTTYANASAQGFDHAKFVDHGQFVANEFEKLGATKVNGFYPNDHTHTSPEGADIVAQAFVRGVVCSKSLLRNHVKNATEEIIGNCLEGGSYNYA